MTLHTFYQDLFSYLCPAGDGVFTYIPGQDDKQVLQAKLYGSDKQKSWQQQVQQLPHKTTPLLLGIPSDCGGGIQRGANWGPLFVRKALYEKLDFNKVLDLGDVRVIPQLLLDDYLNQETIKKCRQALFNDAECNKAVSPLSITSEVVKGIYQQFPLRRLFGIGGDHSVSYPLLKEYLIAKKNQGIKVAVLHFDAHTDLLKQRLGIDISFGSWTYHILPFLGSPAHLIQIGIRATAYDKSYWEKNFNVQQIWATEIKQQGAAKVGQKISSYLKQSLIDEIYVSFDIDCLDSSYAGATGTPESNGLTLQEAITILNEVAKNVRITGADLMEVAPFVRTLLSSNQDEPATTLDSAATIAVNLIGHLS